MRPPPFSEDGLFFLLVVCISIQKNLTRLELHQDFSESAGALNNTGAGAGVGKLKKAERVEKEGQGRRILKILVGNWVAQWDEKYKTWFYYNINTGLSWSGL